MEPTAASQNPFAVLTLIAAPALLTNAASSLAFSTSNRFLRVSERMRELARQLRDEGLSQEDRDFFLGQVNRVERQAILLLRAMRTIYIALGCFASSSLLAITGAVLAGREQAAYLTAVIVTFLLGFVGVGSLVVSSVNLLHATHLSMKNISDSAALIQRQQARRGGNSGAIGRS